MSEASEQAAVIEWANYHTGKWPCLKWLYAIPNGGSRHLIEAVNLKRQGVKSGIADLCLPFPNKRKKGLYLEMKYGNNKLSDNQKDFLAYAGIVGYETAVCYTADEAIKVLEEYLNDR